MRFAVLFLTLLATARADHGRDFLLLQDYEVPLPWSGHAFLGLDGMGDAGLDEWGFETGLSLGLAPLISVGMTAHLAENESGWGVASLAPSLHLQLTPPDGRFPVKAGLWIDYSFALEKEAGQLAEHSHTETPVVCGPEYGPDAPLCGSLAIPAHDHGDAGHDHSDGIHQHGQDVFQARLILEADLTPHDKVLANVILVIPKGGEAAWGYGLGYRHAFHHDFGLGLEVQGDLDRHGQHEALLGAYYSPMHEVLLKLGGGCAQIDDKTRPRLRAGLVWRF